MRLGSWNLTSERARQSSVKIYPTARHARPTASDFVRTPQFGLEVSGFSMRHAKPLLRFLLAILIVETTGWEYVSTYPTYAPYGWTSSSTNGGASLISQSSPYWGGLSSGNGVNYLGLQGRNSYTAQTISGFENGKPYGISFLAAARPDSANYEEQTIEILQNGGRLFYGKVSAGTLSTIFTPYSASFSTDASSVTFLIRNYSPESAGDTTVFLDDLSVFESMNTYCSLIRRSGHE
ncbi:hypothetical protein CYMTET_33036 [Cymbomonas tetramitiformis]|uniref:Uncharacterized protein n=1 Tax=Cymbomonas tetramitiformis TaxID=36881 RepID=A0AAE0FDP6_9CHLO|nr:hypothetical protein CYMTET_33036 [Cymbomonas tetramitiformis]